MKVLTETEYKDLREGGGTLNIDELFGHTHTHKHTHKDGVKRGM